MKPIQPGMSRRRLLQMGGLGVAGGALATSGLYSPALASVDLPDPAEVLARISVKDMVKPLYQEHFKMSGAPIWDNAKDWIRTVDWEKIRAEQAGKTVRFAVTTPEEASARASIEPFKELSGINVELAVYSDSKFYDAVVENFLTGGDSFDALLVFGPWMGDFAAPGFLLPMDEYIEKWAFPMDDFYDTFALNYAKIGFLGTVGIPYDGDMRMTHLRKSYAEKVLGGPVDRWNSIPTHDELLRVATEMGKMGVNGIGIMAAPGFWSTYTWEQIAAQHGMELFDRNWTPVFNSDAGVKGLEMMIQLARLDPNALKGDWPTNRDAFLAGGYGANMTWQDNGTMATRPDMSDIGDDIVTIYEPRAAGGRFAPVNVAGNSACISATSMNPEGAFLLLSFLSTASLTAIAEANADSLGPSYRSVLENPGLQAVSQPNEVWRKSLDHCWCAPRLPGMFEMEQALGNEIQRAVKGEQTAREALDKGAEIWAKLLSESGGSPFEYEALAPGLWVGEGKPLPA